MMPDNIQNRLEELERFHESLKSDDSISYAVDNAFASRLGKNKNTFNKFMLWGSIALVSGSATVVNGLVTVNSIVVLTPTTTAVNTGLRAIATAGLITFSSTDISDGRVLNYIAIY